MLTIASCQSRGLRNIAACENILQDQKASLAVALTTK